MKEHNIKYENGNYWVYGDKRSYTVYKCGVVASTADSSYESTPDGLSIAVARCDYLARKDASN